MSIADFKSDFSLLLKRYVIVSASPTDESAKEISSSSAPKHQELLDAIRDVLRAVLDVKLQYLEEAALRTPANNEIVVATPDAPDVLRMDYNQSARFESFKSTFADGETDFHGHLHTHHEEKAQVLDNDISGDKANNNNNKEAKNANLSTTTSVAQNKEQCNPQQKTILGHMIQESRLNLQKVASSLQRMSDILTPEVRQPEPAHAVRRLSAILNPLVASKKPPSSSTSTCLRSTIQRAKVAAARRSLAAAASDDVITTPTTSRPSSLSGGLSTTTKKAPAVAAATISKLAQHSVSMSSFSSVDKTSKSPVRPAKNPKYAHVQSTIPRPAALVKKRT